LSIFLSKGMSAGSGRFCYEYSILSGDNFGRWRFLFLPTGYPCRGKWLFGWGLFYPYVTPAGANGFLGGFILSIRNPCRGKWLFGWGYFCDHNRESTHRIPLPGQMAFGWVISIHTKPLPGQMAFWVGLFYPYETPAGANGILGGFILSIRNPCRGKWHFGCDYFCDHNRESTHRTPLPGQMASWVGLFYPYETPAGANGFLGGFILSIRNPCRGKRHFGWGLFYPQVTPAGANGIFGCDYFYDHNRESTHRIPLPGQKAFWVGFILPTGYPCRGKRHFGWGLFYPQVTPAGANGFLGGDYFYPYETPAGANGFLVGFILSIRNPCRGKWHFWVRLFLRPQS